jgi:glutaredoxin
MVALTIYSRPGCHLCEEMKALIDRVAADAAIAVRVDEINIAEDQELETRYGSEIPVLLLNGRKVAKYRVTGPALARLLQTG